MNNSPLRIGHSVRSDNAKVESKKPIWKTHRYTGNSREFSGNQRFLGTIVELRKRKIIEVVATHKSLSQILF